MQSIQAWSLASAGVAFITLGTVGTAQAATIIDTIPNWDRVYSIGPFGEYVGPPPSAGIGVFGQTFTVGEDNVLTDFTFFLRNTPDAANIDIAGYVMGWDGTKATGSILYQSAPRPVSPTTSTTAPLFGEFTFNTGGISLSPGSQYVAFISVANLVEPPFGTTFVGQVNGNPYPGGDLVFLQYGSINEVTNVDPVVLTTSTAWQRHVTRPGIFDDAAFRASLVSQNQPIPEATATWGILGLGFLGAVAKLKKGKATKNISV